MKSLSDCPCSTKRTQAAADRLVGFMTSVWHVLIRLGVWTQHTLTK